MTNEPIPIRRTLTVPEVNEVGRIERIVAGFQEKLMAPSTTPEKYLEMAEQSKPLEDRLNERVLELLSECYGMTKEDAAKLKFVAYSEMWTDLLKESTGLPKNSKQQSQKPSPLETTIAQR